MQPGGRPCCPTPRREPELTPIPQSATEDLADVSRVLAGDVAAFEGIVRRWQTPLVNMAWRYCRDRGARRRAGPGGLRPRLAGPLPVAARVQLLHLAVRAGSQRFPHGVEALSHRHGPARIRARALRATIPAPRPRRELATRCAPPGRSRPALALSRAGGSVLLS